jgi:hypothetical protein
MMLYREKSKIIKLRVSHFVSLLNLALPMGKFSNFLVMLKERECRSLESEEIFIHAN